MKISNNPIKKVFENEFWANMIKNVATIFTGTSIASALNMIITIVILWILDAEQYGIFVVAMTYMHVIDTVVNFQSWQGVIRYGAFAISEKNENKLLSVIKAGFLLDMVTSIAGFLIGILVIRVAAIVFGWSDLIQVLCFIFCFEIAFHIEGTVTGVFRLLDKFKYTALCTALAALVKLLVVLLLFFLDIHNTYVFTIVYVLTDIFKHLIYVILGIRLLKQKYKLKMIVKAKLSDLDKEFWHYTIWSNLSTTTDVPIKYFDIFFLSLISNEIVAAYNLFKKIVAVLNLLISPIAQAILPQLSQLVAEGKQKDAYKKIMKLRNVIFGILLPVMVLCGLCAPLLLKIVGQSAYIENINILYALLFYNLCAFSYVGLHPLFSAYGFSKQTTFITLVSNIIYVIWCILLVNKFQVMGIIAGSFLQFILVIVMKQYVIHRKILSGE